MGRGKGGGEQELENSKMVKGGWRGTGGCLGGFQIGPRTFGQWTVGPNCMPQKVEHWSPTICGPIIGTQLSGAQFTANRWEEWEKGEGGRCLLHLGK